MGISMKQRSLFPKTGGKVSSKVAEKQAHRRQKPLFTPRDE
jgi:hypothetical protein